MGEECGKTDGVGSPVLKTMMALVCWRFMDWLCWCDISIPLHRSFWTVTFLAMVLDIYQCYSYVSKRLLRYTGLR